MHLNCLAEMLVWMAAYNRTNYTPYLPVYLLDMRCLPNTHPSVHKHLSAGGFLAHLSRNTFSGIPHDQTIEMIINKDSKTGGGLIGKTLQHHHVSKWMWTAADKARYYECTKSLCQMAVRGPVSHKDGGVHRMAQDEEFV